MTETHFSIRFSLIDLFLVFVAAVALLFWQEANTLVKPFDVYPKLVCAALFALAVACLAQQRLKTAQATPSSSPFQKRIRTCAIIAGIALYIVSISSVGYFVSTFAYLVAMLQIGRFGIPEEFLETKPLLLDSLVAGGVTATIAIVFKISLSLVFPSAWLF